MQQTILRDGQVEQSVVGTRGPVKNTDRTKMVVEQAVELSNYRDAYTSPQPAAAGLELDAGQKIAVCPQGKDSGEIMMGADESIVLSQVEDQ
jgi:hypothetical protein